MEHWYILVIKMYKNPRKILCGLIQTMILNFSTDLSLVQMGCCLFLKLTHERSNKSFNHKVTFAKKWRQLPTRVAKNNQMQNINTWHKCWQKVMKMRGHPNIGAKSDQLELGYGFNRPPTKKWARLLLLIMS